MPSNDQRQPYDYLLQLERKCRVVSPGLPIADTHQEKWSGVLFKLDQFELLGAMAEIVEIGDMLPIARLPGVKPWVIGLANMRGSLLPIIDLGNYLFDSGLPADDSGRLLIVNHGNSLVGLRVDAIVGMRHFFQSQRTGNTPSLPRPLDACVAEGYIDKDAVKPVFSIKRLMNETSFQDAAL